MTSSSAHDSSEALLCRLRDDDDAEAFEVLYQRFSSRVYSFASRKLRDRALAEEALQRVFETLFTKRYQYKSEFSAEQWIFVVSRSEIKDLGVYEQRRKHLNIDDFSGQLSQTPDESPNEHQEGRRAEVSELLKTLSGDQRKALELRYLDEKSFAEIASALGKSESGIRQLVSRGARALKARFAGKKIEDF